MTTTTLPLPRLPPLECGPTIDPAPFADVVREMALEHCKWDAQVGDACALAPFPLVLSRPAWSELSKLATELARETVEIERELLLRPELHGELGLPRALRRVLGELGDVTRPRATPPASRIMRFDFHPTAEGWRVSEVNSDVPGGFTEAHSFARLVAAHTRAGVPAGDPAGRWVDGVARSAGPGSTVALLHAPGWVEDAQVVSYVAVRLRERGIVASLTAPRDLRWTEGLAELPTARGWTPAGAIVRFYQAEWIVRLGCDWRPLFVGGRTPVTNPARAVLAESKRLPLLWPELDAPTATWRSVLMETRDPRSAPLLVHGRGERGGRGVDWLLKPAFGNEGDGLSFAGAGSPARWARAVMRALAQPRGWVAQRRFHPARLDTPHGPKNVCVGVYVVDGAVAGAYGRLSGSEIIDGEATDAAVLVEADGTVRGC